MQFPPLILLFLLLYDHSSLNIDLPKLHSLTFVSLWLLSFEHAWMKYHRQVFSSSWFRYFGFAS
eukprot:m.177910 g.177910  ORF g.177910 m.177910 type:complete len:64 (+) comp15462_c1_seq4:1772-1963(+)